MILFTINDQDFQIDENTYRPVYAKYWNQGWLITATLAEPEDWMPDSISEEWKLLETAQDFIDFAKCIPNRGGYAPGNWEHNRNNFIFSQAERA